MGHNRQSELYAAALVPYTAAAIALASRLAVRRQTGHPMVWEDVLAVIAFVCVPDFGAIRDLLSYSLPGVLSLSSAYTVRGIARSKQLSADDGERCVGDSEGRFKTLTWQRTRLSIITSWNFG
jgi:hypothetical protein